MINLFANIHSIGIIFSKPMSFLAEQNAFETIITVIVGFFKDRIMPIINIVATLINTICKWALTLVDFCFVLIRQMGGLNVDYAKPEDILDDDIIFKFLFDSNVKGILKGLVTLAVVVIIVFGIIAIIKNEFTAVANSVDSVEVKNDKSKIWTSIFQSLFLLIFVPVVFIGGLVMSNAILQTILNGITGAENMTIGSQIFVASTYDANAYRNYADGNQKIPITYQFKQISDYSAISGIDTSGTVAEIQEAMVEYKQAEEWKQGFATFQMFYLSTFFDMDGVDQLQLGGDSVNNNAYNSAYDYNIRTYKYEYYVNADLQDYLMRYGEEIYFKTAQEAYTSCHSVDVQLNMSDGKNGYYEFSVDYVDGREKLTYRHKIDATDESDGAVFLACIKRDYINDSGNTEYYYEPITMNNSRFDSDYLENGDQYVVARGFFEDGTYPTAIKLDKGKVVFYRDRINVPTFGSFLPHISYELPEGVHEASGVKVLKSAIQLFTGIDASEFLPYVYFNVDFNTLFSKATNKVATLDNGGYYLDYSFTSDGVSIEHIYQQANINYVVLVLATVIILLNVIKAFFGLIKRSVDIMFLYLIYPTAISTIPLYGNTNFKDWMKKMTSKVLSLYGLMIGINLALVMIPICASVEIFTPQDLQNTVLSVAPSFSTTMLNYIFQLIFTLVGISMIFKLTSTIQEFVFSGGDIISEGSKVISGTAGFYKGAFGKIKNVVTGKALVETVRGVTGYTDPETGQYHAGWIPGSAGKDLVNKWKETKYGFDKNQQNFEANKQTNKEAIQKALADAKANKNNNRNNTNRSGGAGVPGGGTGVPGGVPGGGAGGPGGGTTP